MFKIVHKFWWAINFKVCNLNLLVWGLFDHLLISNLIFNFCNRMNLHTMGALTGASSLVRSNGFADFADWGYAGTIWKGKNLCASQLQKKGKHHAHICNICKEPQKIHVHTIPVGYCIPYPMPSRGPLRQPEADKGAVEKSEVKRSCICLTFISNDR